MFRRQFLKWVAPLLSVLAGAFGALFRTNPVPILPDTPDATPDVKERGPLILWRLRVDDWRDGHRPLWTWSKINWDLLQPRDVILATAPGCIQLWKLADRGVYKSCGDIDTVDVDAILNLPVPDGETGWGQGIVNVMGAHTAEAVDFIRRHRQQ